MSCSKSTPSSRAKRGFLAATAAMLLAAAGDNRLIGSGNCCQAFALTKVPTSLLGDRHAKLDRGRQKRLDRNNRRSSLAWATAVVSSKDTVRNEPGRSSSSLSAANVGNDDDSSSSIARGRILLGLVALLYGTLNVSLRFVYEVPEIPPTAAALSATRGWLAFGCFLPPWILSLAKERQEKPSETPPSSSSPGLLRSGSELAIWGFLAQGLLNVGLVSTGSARASFLTQTSVLFTPLISSLVLGRDSVRRSTWVACGVALVGLVVLTLGGSGGGAASAAFSMALSEGDLFVLGGALLWSMYLFRISFLGPKHPDLALQGVKTGLMAILYSLWWLGSSWLDHSGGISSLLSSAVPSWMTSGWIVWTALFFSAVGPGTVADVLQQKGQSTGVSPSEANILLSAEPVFATLLAVALLGETTSLLELGGGALILVAALIASV